MKTTPIGNSNTTFMPNAKGLDTSVPARFYEWYTPKHIIKASQDVLGGIYLDPCSNSHVCPNVPSKHRYTKDDNGLVQQWRGTVYMNPPYGRAITAWIDKLLYHYTAGDVTEAIALLPASTATKWFAKLAFFPQCFIHRRLHFLNHQGRDVGAANYSSVVFYFGKNTKRFCEVFGTLGGIYQCTQPYTPVQNRQW